MRTFLARRLRVKISPRYSLSPKGTDGSHVVSRWLSEPATTAVSMADQEAAGDRRRTRQGGSAAQDGGPATFLSPRGMGEAQGKKVAASPLRQGDRGAAALWPDRASMRRRRRVPDGLQGKSCVRGTAQESGVAGREIANLARGKTPRIPEPWLAEKCSIQRCSVRRYRVVYRIAAGTARSPQA
jgi:hypothetical protein